VFACCAFAEILETIHPSETVPGGAKAAIL
jgi:hypothetical protein